MSPVVAIDLFLKNEAANLHYIFFFHNQISISNMKMYQNQKIKKILRLLK
jgi:hypothetical protein